MKIEGTIIGKLPLTETSLIVKWCSAGRGIMKTVAKGARRPKSPFAGKIDLFFRCELEVHEAKTSDLHILKDLCVLDSRVGLRRDYRQTLAGALFVKWIEKAAEPETPVPELNDLLNRALDFLDEKEVDLRAVEHFEKQLAGILGILPEKNEALGALEAQVGARPVQRSELLALLKS